MNINFISLGGWCGTKIALKDLDYLEPSFPFDYVRSSIEGIIDCLQNDFINYFPKNIEINNNFINYKPYLGEYIGFYHENLLDNNVIES